MNHETTSSAAGEEDGGTAVLQPLPVSDELISRLAGKCEEIFPLESRFRRDEISDDEIHEMESLLKRFRPSPAKVLFREQCCALMCAESEHEMETRLKRLSASSMLEFSVCKMAQAMNCASDEKREKALNIPLWREVPSEKAETPVIPGEKRELLRTPTLFELQGGDERVPVIAPAVIRKILPEKEY